MQRKTHGKIDYSVRAIFTVGIIIAAICCTVYAVVGFDKFQNPNALFSEVIVILVALALWGIAAYTLRSISTNVTVDENGMRVFRFGITQVFIKWDEIVEVGIGQTPTSQGRISKLYFSNTELTDEIRNDLDNAQRCTVYFSNPSQEWLDYIKKYCPLPLPSNTEKLGETGGEICYIRKSGEKSANY